MNEHSIHLKISAMEADIRKMLYQRTLQQHTSGPTISRARLFFLLLPELTGSQWTEDIRMSAKTVSIVYAALHAHDLIEEEGPPSKEQQLTVLAGDFYSGLYYQLLANVKNIELIRDLASAIIAVSESKAALYDREVQSLGGIERAVERIEASLVDAFYAFYGYEQYSNFARLSLVYLRYSDELRKMQAGEYSLLLWKLDEYFHTGAQKEAWLSKKLDELQVRISREAGTNAFPYHVDNYLHHHLIPHRISIELSN